MIQVEVGAQVSRYVRIGIIVAVVAVAGIAWWWYSSRTHASDELTLYGNIDLRQVELPFNGTERIASVDAREGDRVAEGTVLARLDTSRLAPQLAQVEASAAAQEQVVERLRHGSRPEEIAQARANVELAAADAQSAHARFERMQALFMSSSGRAVSRQDVDDASAAADVAAARLTVNRKALELAIAGPRREDVLEAQARLAAQQAQVALLKQQIEDASLKAPLSAVVRSRLVEPGEMASPAKPAFTLAITDPKWVRAYISEKDLGRVRAGMAATVSVDAFDGRRFEGWVGFISPAAEFTPKSVQTEELRESLVYEIRVFVKDPADELKLGMPATVHLPLHPPPQQPQAK
ncbi:MAG TPA: efflux RND transporter periplasmic adaptor subunit [Steroidobacteraceae bacterium]|nr:efflux RND transporter periplasmic adaptor subunit [Steroidobacteraceae bacterium]